MGETLYVIKVTSLKRPQVSGYIQSYIRDIFLCPTTVLAAKFNEAEAAECVGLLRVSWFGEKYNIEMEEFKL